MIAMTTSSSIKVNARRVLNGRFIENRTGEIWRGDCVQGRSFSPDTSERGFIFTHLMLTGSFGVSFNATSMLPPIERLSGEPWAYAIEVGPRRQGRCSRPGLVHAKGEIPFRRAGEVVRSSRVCPPLGRLARKRHAPWEQSLRHDHRDQLRRIRSVLLSVLSLNATRFI